MLKIPNVFVHDAYHRAVPAIRAGCEWVLSQNALMTLKLDGITIKVEWDNTAVKWKLTQLHSNGMIDLDLGREYNDDAHIFAAFDKATVKGTGTYLLYGESINGNPHGLTGTYWVKLFPCHHDLLVPRHKTIVKREHGTTVQEFFDSVKQELTESPEIQGICFHQENEKLETVACAKVLRKEFGLEWPVQQPAPKQLQIAGLHI